MVRLCRRCYVRIPVKGEFEFRREIPICIACCYSVVTVLAGRPFNEFALRSGIGFENRISLRDGLKITSHQRRIDLDSRWTLGGCENFVLASESHPLVPVSQVAVVVSSAALLARSVSV